MIKVSHKSMRVLHLLKTSIGASWALRQMRGLVMLGVEVHVAIPPGGPLVEQYASAGVVVHQLSLDFPIRAPWQFVDMAKRLRTLVAQVKPDLIHSHFVGTTLTMRLALGKRHPIPRVFQVPGPLHLEHPFFRMAEIMTAGPNDFWIGSCKWTCDRYLRSGVSPVKVFLSYYGVDLNNFQSGVPGCLRRELETAEDAKLVGMIAYMYAPKRYLGQRRGLKGHEDFIDAIATCRQKDPRIVGVVIGGAWAGAASYERQVREYARQRCGAGVVFLGTRNDVPLLYPDLDLAVHPSHSENVGGAVESLLMTVPTIATHVGGFPDLVIDGQTGKLVPPRSPGQLAAIIHEMLSDETEARRMAQAGRELAKKLLDVRHNAREVQSAYQAILRAS